MARRVEAIATSQKVGFMRLHPVNDGLVPDPDEKGVKTHDSGGNRLIDVIDPKTGYVTGVRSPMTIQGDRGVINPSPISAGRDEIVRFDGETGTYYDLARSDDSDPVGIVVRTVEDGDDPLRVARIRIYQAGKSDSSGSTAKTPRKKTARQENDEAANALFRVMAKDGRFLVRLVQAGISNDELLRMQRNPETFQVRGIVRRVLLDMIAEQKRQHALDVPDED